MGEQGAGRTEEAGKWGQAGGAHSRSVLLLLPPAIQAFSRSAGRGAGCLQGKRISKELVWFITTFYEITEQPSDAQVCRWHCMALQTSGHLC